MQKKNTRCCASSTRCCTSSIILPIILSLFSFLFAGAPDTLWTRTYGGDKDDVGYSVQQTSDGGFIIVGKTGFSGAGKEDIYLIRTNVNGDTLWTRRYGGDSTDVGYSIQVTNDGGFVIAGITWNLVSTSYDAYLLKTNSDGDTVWTKTYGGNKYDVAHCIQLTNDSGFIITGYTYSFGVGETDIYLIRTDLNGDTLWTKTYGGTDSDCGYSVQQTSDSGFILTGFTASYSSDNRGDICLIKTNPNGDTLWLKTYGGADYDGGYSVQQTTDGGYIIAGRTYSFGVGGGDIYIIRTDSIGDSLWTKTYGENDYDEANSLCQINDGGFIITGSKSSNINSNDVYIVRIDSNGDTLWAKTYGGTESDCGYSILQTKDGGFIVVGRTRSFDDDVYLIRLDKETVEIQDDNLFNIIKPNNFLVSSSQGNISIRYTLPFSSRIKLEAFDIQGRLVEVIEDRFMHKGSYRVTWDSKRLGAGVYIIRLKVPGPALSLTKCSEVSSKVTILQ